MPHSNREYYPRTCLTGEIVDFGRNGDYAPAFSSTAEFPRVSAPGTLADPASDDFHSNLPDYVPETWIRVVISLE